MSSIANIYNGIIANIGGDLFVDKSRIPYPYDLPSNNEKFLANGWGLKVGTATHNEQAEYGSVFAAREFSVVVTRELFSTDSDTDQKDDIGLQLLEDIFEASKRVYGTDKMGVSEISNVTLGPSSAVVEVVAGNKKFVSMEVAFNVEYFESLT